MEERIVWERDAQPEPADVERCRAARAGAAVATGGIYWLRSAPFAGGVAPAERDEPADAAGALLEGPAKDVARPALPASGCQDAGWVHFAESRIAKARIRQAATAGEHSAEVHSQVRSAVEAHSALRVGSGATHSMAHSAAAVRSAVPVRSVERHLAVRWAVPARSVERFPLAHSDVAAHWAALVRWAVLRSRVRQADSVRSADLARPVSEHLRAGCRERFRRARACAPAQCEPVVMPPDAARKRLEAEWDSASR